jgi:hypothetical protein
VFASLLILVLIGLVLGGGGLFGGSDNKTTQPTTTVPPRPATGSASAYAAAIAVTIRADPGFTTVPKKDALCAGSGVVKAVGLDTLHRLGLSPQQIREQKQLPPLAGSLSQPQAIALTNALLRCINFGRVIATQLAAGSVKVTDAQAECINDKIKNSPDARDAIAQSYTGEPGGTSKSTLSLVTLASECIPTTPTS